MLGSLALVMGHRSKASADRSKAIPDTQLRALLLTLCAADYLHHRRIPTSLAARLDLLAAVRAPPQFAPVACTTRIPAERPDFTTER
jgi:hypothetical protein